MNLPPKPRVVETKEAFRKHCTKHRHCAVVVLRRPIDTAEKSRLRRLSKRFRTVHFVVANLRKACPRVHRTPQWTLNVAWLLRGVGG